MTHRRSEPSPESWLLPSAIGQNCTTTSDRRAAPMCRSLVIVDGRTGEARAAHDFQFGSAHALTSRQSVNPDSCRPWNIGYVEGNRIRQADPTDYERVIAVTHEWWNRDVSAGLPRLFLDHFWTTSFVAEEAETTTGFLIGFHSPSEADTAYVHYVATSPAVRRSGLARALYEQFFNHAREEGRRVVRAITSASNNDSIAFHKAIGFAASEPIPDYNGPGRPAVKFELFLT